MCKATMMSDKISRFIIVIGTGVFQVTAPICSWAQDKGDLGTTGTMTPAVSFLQVIGALGLIIGLMALLFVVLKKMGWNRTALKQGSLIHVLDSRMITPKKSLVAVQIGGEETLLLGVSEQNITLLSRLKNNDLIKGDVDREEKAEGQGFASLLSKASRRTEKKKKE